MSQPAIVPLPEATEMRVGTLMTRHVTTLDRNDTMDIAAEIMAAGRLRHLPVIDGGRVVGVVSERDLFRPGLARALGYGSKARRTLLRSLSVKEIMTEPAVTLAPEAPVREAAQLMLERRIGCVPVVEAGALVGLVTESDLLRHAYALGGGAP
jgi:CBS domain-containing protein